MLFSSIDNDQVKRLSKMGQLWLSSKHYLPLLSSATMTFSLHARSDVCATFLQLLLSSPLHTYLKPPLTPTSPPPSPLNKHLMPSSSTNRDSLQLWRLYFPRHLTSLSPRIPLHRPHKHFTPHLNHPPPFSTNTSRLLLSPSENTIKSV